MVAIYTSLNIFRCDEKTSLKFVWLAPCKGVFVLSKRHLVYVGDVGSRYEMLGRITQRILQSRATAQSPLHKN